MLLFVVGLGVFITPFAFPTPPPIVRGFTSTLLFSPNGDGQRDIARVAFRLNEPGTATVTIADPPDRGGAVRRTLAEGPQPKGVVRLEWDGLDDAGIAVPDGRYVVSLRARAGRKQWNSSRSTVVDRQAPAVADAGTSSAILDGPGEGQCRVRATALERGEITIEAGPVAGARAALARFGPQIATPGRQVTWSWNGRTADGKPVPPGLYLTRTALADRARNVTTREATCWVGHAIGTAVPARPRLGQQVGARLRRPDGTPLPAGTRVTLSIARRTGTPGPDRAVVGAPVGGTATGPMSRVRVTIPRQIPPRLLWLVATTDDARVLIPLRP